MESETESTDDTRERGGAADWVVVGVAWACGVVGGVVDDVLSATCSLRLTPASCLFVKMLRNLIGARA